MARRIARSFVRGPRKATDWSASSVATALVTLAGSSVVLLEIFVPISGGETLIRTRGFFTYGSDQAAANENIIGAVGIGVVSEQAATVGITAVPHPDTDSAWGGWLWHHYFAARIEVGSAVGFDPLMQQNIVIDSKAMRKVGDSERLVVVVENSSATGMRFSTAMRLLSKIH